MENETTEVKEATVTDLLTKQNELLEKIYNTLIEMKEGGLHVNNHQRPAVAPIAEPEKDLEYEPAKEMRLKASVDLYHNVKKNDIVVVTEVKNNGKTVVVIPEKDMEATPEAFAAVNFVPAD